MGIAPPTGLAPATSGLTGRRYHWLSYGGIVRALGLERSRRRVEAKRSSPRPSLVRGKSPVPYLSGVTRIVGREGIEPPVSDDGWSTASCAPWRDRPMSRPGGTGPDDDVSAVVKVLVARLVAGRVEAGSEGVEPPVVGVGDRDTAMARARVECAHDVVRVVQGSAADPTESVGATSARRCCRHWQAPVVPADPLDRGRGRVCTRARRRSTGIDPGALVRRCGCVP